MVPYSAFAVESVFSCDVLQNCSVLTKTVEESQWFLVMFSGTAVCWQRQWKRVSVFLWCSPELQCADKDSGRESVFSCDVLQNCSVLTKTVEESQCFLVMFSRTAVCWQRQWKRVSVFLWCSPELQCADKDSGRESVFSCNVLQNCSVLTKTVEESQCFLVMFSRTAVCWQRQWKRVSVFL